MIEQFFPELKSYAQNFVASYGYTAIFLISFTESLIQPIPPYPFIVGAPLFKLSTYIAGAVALLGNMLGALVAYYMASFLGEAFVKRLLGERMYLKGESVFNKYGFFAVLIGEPYKLVCWLSGIFKMPLLSFLVASLIARGIRIGAFVFFGNFLEKLIN
ncbi:MAG: VTT domain-containing protein [Hydrogenobacter sp.]